MYDEPFQINLTQEELTVLQALVDAGAHSADFNGVLDTLASVVHKVSEPLDLNA